MKRYFHQPDQSEIPLMGPSAGEPGLKRVSIKAYWGTPGEIIHFVVDMKESIDVYNEASKKTKEAAAQAGADPSMAVYEVISIEDL